jgi:acetyl esterase/lipase
MSSPSQPKIHIEKDVVFGHTDTRELRCDVYSPEESEGLAPGILMLHGGGWSTGDPSMMAGYGRLMARRGYVCVCSEYRLSGEAAWPAQLEDARAALQWLRGEHASLSVDPDQIVVWGQSAGGHLALFLAGGAARLLDGPSAKQEVTAAAIAFYPITTIGPEMGEAWERYGEGLVPRDASEQQRSLLAPLNYVDEKFPPTLLLHGTNDTLVSPGQSLSFYDTLQEKNVPASLHLFASLGHGFDLDRELALQSADLTTMFLEQHLVPNRDD